MFKTILFLFISLLSFNSFAVDETVSTKDVYNWGKYDKNQYKWLGDIQESFHTINIIKLNCNKNNNFSCKLVCEDDIYENIDLMFVGMDDLGSRVVTFYQSNGLFSIIQTQSSCSYSNFIPMISYSHNSDV